MHEPIHASPACRKCKRPMVFHSLQTVEGKLGEETVRVYECKACERLTAVSTIRRAA